MATPNDIAHWRAQIFARLLLVVFALGLGTALPSALLAAREGLWSVMAIDVAALLWLYGIWRLRQVAHGVRVLHFLAMNYLVGVGLLLKVGPLSQIYLLAIPVLAALLLGLRPALYALGLTALTVLAVAYLAPAPPLDSPPDTAGLKALVITANYLFIAAVLTLSCALLLRHLAGSLAALALGQRELRALNGELHLTAAAVARLNDMVLIARVDPDGEHITFVNAAFERRSGYARAEVLGRGLRLSRGPDTEPAELARIASAMARGETVRAELLNYSKTGEPYWVEMEMLPFADGGGDYTHWVAVERDISERKQSQDDIHRLAYFDVLTGLPNRRLLLDRIAQLLAGAQRGAGHSAVMYIDLDRFKFINDARGHGTGDAVLRGAAERLSRLVRQADTVARMGGDEFVVLLARLGEDRAAATHAARRVAEKIRHAIAAPLQIDGQSYSCSASVGVTLLPQPGRDAHDLLREADTALYRAKAGDGIAFFEAAMQADLELRLSLERDLAQALAGGQLRMHAQVQVDRHGRAVGAELLMRWIRADGVSVAPSLFIPVAEESGLIVELGLWALRQACAMARTLERAGHRLPLSVNVSPRQFRQDDFVAQVGQALAASGAAPAMLVLEVTEGLLIDRFDATIARMRELAALGVRFSIDDFGTGYSSLAYLKQMPLYELKIDRAFIVDTPDDANSRALVQAILAMARQLRLRVVAEGVETRAQAAFLIAHDCDSLQGFLYARPEPPAALLARLGSQAQPAPVA